MRHIKSTFTLGLLCILLALSGITSLSQPVQAQSGPTGDGYVDPQSAPYQRLLAASQVPATVNFRAGGFPRSIVGMFPTTGRNQVERALDFIDQYRDLFLLDHPDLALKLRTTIGLTEAGEEVVVFEQTYHGIKVEGAKLMVTVLGEHVYAASGNLLTRPMIAAANLDPRPALSFTDVRVRAREVLGDPEVEIPFSPELRIYDNALFDLSGRPQPQLAWLVLTETDRLLIDAHTGEVLSHYERVAADTGFDLDLEHAHGSNSEDTGCYWWTTANESVGDEDGVDAEWQDDVDVMAAWEAALGAYDFYYNLGLDSYDDSDGELEVYVYANFPDNGVGGLDNANWQAGFGCDLIQFRAGRVAFDRMVHEYTHAVLEYRDAGTLYANDMEISINEGLAYIMAAYADGNWTIGENSTNGSGPSWDLANPASNGAPDQWSEYSSANTKHANSMILGRAANLITAGGAFNGYTVNGIGNGKALRLFFGVVLGVPAGSDFRDVRDTAVVIANFYAHPPQIINAGQPLFGFTDQDVCAVRNGFAAVELGNGDVNCDGIEEPNINDPDQDGIWSAADNCPNHWNPMQDDWDGDGLGNPCDPLEGIDEDQDGVPTQCYGDICGLPDNCPNIYNPEQTDGNLNGIGRACDPTEDGDYDDDGVPNEDDNCLLTYNPDQANIDADVDDVGDACDPDEDGDGWSNDDDNCVGTYNPDQANSDNDPLGDVCDICPTGDNMTGVAEGYIDVNPYDDQPGETVYYYDEETYSCAGGVTRPDLQGIPIVNRGGILTSDCQPYDITVLANPGGYETLPINLETAQDLDWYPRGTRLTVTMEGLPEDVRTWIQDSDGRSFGESNVAGPRTLSLRPLGEQHYALGMAFRTDMQAGQPITFNGRIGLEYGGVALCSSTSTAPLSVSTVTPVAPIAPAPTSQSTLPPPPPTATPDQCGGFRLTSPSGGMYDSPMTFYWDPAPAAQFYRINIFDQDSGILLFQGDSPAPNTNANLDVSVAAIGGGMNLLVEMQALANGQVICTSRVPQHREMPPAPPQGAPQGAACTITLLETALVYQIPVVDTANIFDQMQPGAQTTVVGRLADNSWWKLAYYDSWIETSRVMAATSTSGDCGNLPVVAP